jgi:sugar lactone lactonase YvrE
MKPVRFTIFISAIYYLLLFSCSKTESTPSTLPPSILSVSSTSFATSDTINISGTNFSTVLAENTVKFNNISATIVQSSTTQIQVIVPAGLSSGNASISVSVKGVVATYNFSLIKIPNVKVIAGAAYLSGLTSIDGDALSARFNLPCGMAIDKFGNIYVCDRVNHKIRKITPTGIVSTYAGTGTPGEVDGNATSATLYYPTNIVIDPAGNLYVCQLGKNTIRKINTSGIVSTFVAQSNPNNLNSLTWPSDMIFDAFGNLFVADLSRVQKVSSSGTIFDFAGGNKSGNGRLDGTGAGAGFVSVLGTTIDASGNLYATDVYGIRKITPGGVVTTFAGGQQPGKNDGTGTTALFNTPMGIVTDLSGNMYVCDQTNNLIRKITPSGVVTTLSGSYKAGVVTTDLFFKPSYIAIDSSGDLYITQSSDNRIYKVSF